MSAAQVSGIEPIGPLAGVFWHGVAQEVEVTVEFPLFWSVDASIEFRFGEQTATIVDGTGLGGLRCGWLGGVFMLVGVLVFVGVLVLVGVLVGVLVLVAVLVAVLVSVFVFVFVSMFVMVMMIVVTTSQKFLEIGSAVYHADHCEAQD